jgi:hypothetical protein
MPNSVYADDQTAAQISDCFPWLEGAFEVVEPNTPEQLETPFWHVRNFKLAKSILFCSFV